MAASYQDGRVIVRPGVVEVDGKPFRVGAHTRVEAVADPPSFIRGWMVLLGFSLLGVPCGLVLTAVAPGVHSWLVTIPAIGALVSIGRLLTASTRYHVTLVEQGSRSIYSSEDLQTIVFLVAMVRDAVPRTR